MNTAWRWIWSGSLLFVLILPALSQGSLLGFMTDGDPVMSVSARVAAMGGASLALDGAELAAFANPAHAAYVEGPGIWLTVGRRMTSEEIVGPEAEPGEFDARSTSQRLFEPLSAGIQWAPGRRVGISLATIPCYDYRYESEIVIRDAIRPGRAIGVERLEGRGGLRQHVAALGVRPAWWLSLGLAGALVRGQRDTERATHYYDPDSQSTASHVSEDLDSELYSVGLQVRATRSLRIAAVYRSGLDVGTISYPASLGLGVAYGTGTGRGALFAADLLYRDAGGSFELGRALEAIELRVGSEIRLRGDASVRYGLALIPWYRDDTIEKALISAGMGRRVFGLMVDVAASVGTRNYRGQAPYLSEESRVNESTTRVVVTVSYGT